MQPRVLVFLIFFVANITNALAFDHSHGKFNLLLQTHVKFKNKQSFINYLKIKKNSVSLENYLKSLSSVSKKEFKKFSKDEQLAFLINAYNAFTIKIIIDNYPVKSIKDIGSFFTNTWKMKFFTLLEEKSHLDNIEHNLIRKQFNEPRIHFAVNCASIGCPSLQRKAFTAKNLNILLESATNNFLSNTTKNKFEKNKKEIKLSKIFKWYGEDFKKKFGSIEKFIAKYLTSNSNDQKNIINEKFSLTWTDYDWKLNESK
jgi:hypothetical protein